MEESKLYTTQEIEKLKQKIDTYRGTLTSLKMGTSIEDFLFMKQDFDGLKTQIAHLEGLTETLDSKQNSHLKGYEDQIRLLSTQIESLNQTMEELNQEILTVLNKLVTVEVNDVTKTLSSTAKTDHTSAINLSTQPRITQTAEQSSITSAQPSYRLLQSLAGKATNKQSNVNNGGPSPQNDIQRNKPEERHFNQQYFQSINTHPSQIYNGLYRNTTVESTFHFKNATDAHEVPVNVYDPSAAQPTVSGEIIENDTSHASIESGSMETEILDEPIEVMNTEKEIERDNSELSKESFKLVISETSNDPVNQDSAELTSNQVVSEKITEPIDAYHSPSLETEEYVEVYHAGAVYEVHPSLEEEIIHLEPVNKPIEEEHKKGKNSFFDFFKRWS